MNDKILTQEELVKLLKDNGAIDEEIEKTLQDLDQLVIIKATKELLSRKPSVKKLTSDEEIANYLKDNFEKEDIISVFEETALNVIKDYSKALGI